MKYIVHDETIDEPGAAAGSSKSVAISSAVKIATRGHLARVYCVDDER